MHTGMQHVALLECHPESAVQTVLQVELIQAHLTRRHPRPAAGIQPVVGVGAPIAHTLEDHARDYNERRPRSGLGALPDNPGATGALMMLDLGGVLTATGSTTHSSFPRADA